MISLRKNSKGVLHVVMLVVAIVATGLLAMGLTVYNYNKKEQAKITTEAALFKQLGADAQRYIAAINAKYPGEQTHEAYCSYSSAVYGRGSLSCDVVSSVVYPLPTNDAHVIVEEADQKLAMLLWGAYKDLTQSNKHYSKTLVKFISYPRLGAKQSCSVGYYETIDNLLLEAECSGSALAEHYPVKE